jgi:antitoxin PrlF
MPVMVTRKGQVTIPKVVRYHLGIKPGSKVVFELGPGACVILRLVGKHAPMSSRLQRMRGTATSGMTTDEIMALVRGAE